MDIKLQCLYCRGTKIQGLNDCPICHGTGLSAPMVVAPGYFHSVDVVGCINFGEFNALGANNKEDVKLILSAGYVNMNQGSPTMIKLFMCFPEGTATATSLLALMGQA